MLVIITMMIIVIITINNIVTYYYFKRAHMPARAGRLLGPAESRAARSLIIIINNNNSNINNNNNNNNDTYMSRLDCMFQKYAFEKLLTLLDLCVSSLRRGAMLIFSVSFQF